MNMSLFRGLTKPPRFLRYLNTTAALREPAGYLSESYLCNDAWNKRLESSLLKKIDLDDLFFEMDKKYQAEKVISSIDVDLFANKVNSEEYFEELEELSHRLRKSPATASTLPSTSHAVLRAFLAFNKFDEIMRLLNDRMNYGIFTDSFISNILMDTFLAEKRFRDAAKIASLHMLEENFGPSTTKCYCLLSCLKYIENQTSEPWEPEPPVDPRDKSKEETKIKVKFLRQPGFDDHFDLSEPLHIVGKTLAYLSMELNEGDDVLRRSVELLGWALYDKWERVDNLLNRGIDKKLSYSTEVIQKITELAEAKLKLIEESPDKALPKPKLKRVPGMNLDKGSVALLFEQLNIPDYSKIIPGVKSLLTSGKVVAVDISLTSKAEELLKQALANNASAEMKTQVNLYQEWEKIRTDSLLQQVQQFKNEQKLQEIHEKKKELAEKEDTIFFFDNEEEWMMRQPPAVRVYRMRWRGKYKPPKVTEDDTYVPPVL